METFFLKKVSIVSSYVKNYFLIITNSVRRFLALPSGVSFVAIGRDLPKPSYFSLEAFIPCWIK